MGKARTKKVNRDRRNAAALRKKLEEKRMEELQKLIQAGEQAKWETKFKEKPSYIVQHGKLCELVIEKAEDFLKEEKGEFIMHDGPILSMKDEKFISLLQKTKQIYLLSIQGKSCDLVWECIELPFVRVHCNFVTYLCDVICILHTKCNCTLDYEAVGAFYYGVLLHCVLHHIEISRIYNVIAEMLYGE